MDLTQLHEPLQGPVNMFLSWIGYGTLIGLLAKAIMPGRDPGGPLMTLAMGIAGVVIGLGTVSLILKGPHVDPISPLGLMAGVGGAFMILAFYKALAGSWQFEGHPPGQLPAGEHRRPRRSGGRRRRRVRRRDDDHEYFLDEPEYSDW